MEIEFDPAKDAENTRKHGVSLQIAAGLVWEEASMPGRMIVSRTRNGACRRWFRSETASFTFPTWTGAKSGALSA
jgi:uncharacterized DUF497 family protein